MGQREQVAYQGLHAQRLLRHQLQHAAAFDFGECQVDHGFDEACQHRQRRADFVRHIGHEIASHRVVALALGDVLRQHQLHAVAIASDQHRNGSARPRAGEGDHLVEHARLKTGHEGRGAHEVGDALAAIALRIEPEVVRHDRIAPLDLVIRVEQHHAIG